MLTLSFHWCRLCSHFRRCRHWLLMKIIFVKIEDYFRYFHFHFFFFLDAFIISSHARWNTPLLLQLTLFSLLSMRKPMMPFSSFYYAIIIFDIISPCKDIIFIDVSPLSRCAMCHYFHFHFRCKIFHFLYGHYMWPLFSLYAITTPSFIAGCSRCHYRASFDADYFRRWWRLIIFSFIFDAEFSHYFSKTLSIIFIFFTKM